MFGRLAPGIRQALEETGATRLYEDVERPLVRVLAKMEVAGIAVDIDRLRAISDELTSEARRLEAEVQQLAGEEFNVNSTPQLRRILFEKLELVPQKRTKTGYSTDAQSLARLRDAHPVVDTLLRYREVEKLRSTYGEGLLAEVAPDGRIHASFNQTVARTGRLSSDQPNLHNIPVRSLHRAALPRGVRPERRLGAAHRRLRPDRAARDRPPRRRSRARRGVPRRASTSTTPPRRGSTASSRPT